MDSANGNMYNNNFLLWQESPDRVELVIARRPKADVAIQITDYGRDCGDSLLRL